MTGMAIKTLDLGQFIFNNASPFSISPIISRSRARLAAEDKSNSLGTTRQGRKGRRRLAVTIYYLKQAQSIQSSEEEQTEDQTTMRWKEGFPANRTWITLSKQASKINKQSAKNTYQGLFLTATHETPDHTKKGAESKVNQMNRQARTTSYECYPECQSFLLPRLQPDSKQKEWEMETVISATDLLWMRHCRKVQSMSSRSLAVPCCQDFPGSMGQQPESHFYGSRWHEGRKKAFLYCFS